MTPKRINLGKSDRQPDPWEAELNRRIVMFVILRGSLVSHRESEYGWMAEDTGEREHVVECGLSVPRCTWEDKEWSEFAGTFADQPYENYSGVDAVATCACGLVEGERFRYKGGHADLLRAVTGSGW